LDSLASFSEPATLATEVPVGPSGVAEARDAGRGAGAGGGKGGVVDDDDGAGVVDWPGLLSLVDAGVAVPVRVGVGVEVGVTLGV